MHEKLNRLLHQQMEIRETQANTTTKTEDKKMKRREVVVESLGWLTESTILPKKHRAIEGVGASSILELKAQLYKSQEEAKKSKDLSSSSDLSYHRAKSKIPASRDAFSVKNSGVEARALKDKLELKAVNDGSASYAALEKKAELYEKLMRGELSDEEENEKYCVDFFRKQEEDPPEQSGGSGATSTAAAERQENEEIDGGEDSVLFGMGFVAPGRTAGAVDRDEHKRFVRQVHEEASQAREKASELKSRRQAQAAAHREKLRQAYLRKKLEKLKSSSNPEQT